MTRQRALPVVLEVLDDGFRVYRRHLASFTLVATAAMVALAVLALSFLALVRSELGTSSGWSFAGFLVMLMLGYPLLLYTFAALSRATEAALNGQPVQLAASFRIGPARGCGMLIFNLLFGLISSIVAGMLSAVLACPLMYLTILGGSLAASVTSSAGSSIGIAVVVIVSQLSSLWSVTMFGAWIASSVFALQAFVLERRSWGAAMGRSVDLLISRIGLSLLMFFGAGAIFGTLAISYLGSLVTLIAIVQDRFAPELAPLVGDALYLAVVVFSLVVLLPPVAIWMALFHHRLARERDGADLIQRVARWREQPVS